MNFNVKDGNIYIGNVMLCEIGKLISTKAVDANYLDKFVSVNRLSHVKDMDAIEIRREYMWHVNEYMATVSKAPETRFVGGDWSSNLESERRQNDDGSNYYHILTDKVTHDDMLYVTDYNNQSEVGKLIIDSCSDFFIKYIERGLEYPNDLAHHIFWWTLAYHRNELEKLLFMTLDSFKHLFNFQNDIPSVIFKLNLLEGVHKIRPGYLSDGKTYDNYSIDIVNPVKSSSSMVLQSEALLLNALSDNLLSPYLKINYVDFAKIPDLGEEIKKAFCALYAVDDLITHRLRNLTMA